jgi:hypothetical protein
MCINAETSLLSFIIGELCGLTLLTKNKEKQILGTFVMFYSLVQLFEYKIYKNENINLNSRLLLLNLGFQGLFLFLLLSKFCEVNKIYIIVCALIALYILYKATKKNFKNATIDNCMEWNFMENDVSFVLLIMYGILIFWMLTNNCNKYFNEAGYFFVGTLLISYTLTNKNSPSFWCMSSAILAPIFLLL